MRKITASLLIIFSFTWIAFSQSGRRTDAKPAPTATPAGWMQDERGQYSESVPLPRRIRKAQPKSPQASAQNAKPKPDDDEVVRVETKLITIPVTVYDRNGLYVPGLRKEEFRIFEDGIEQEIAYFGVSDKPVTVALVLDVSPSTEYRIEEIIRAAKAFVTLLEPDDKVIVIDFDSSVRVRTKPTNDREQIFKAIEKARFGNGTSLYNAVDEAIRKQLGKIEGRKAVLLFTDGVDTTSRKNSYDSTLDHAEESDSIVFPIYYNTFLDNRRRLGSPFPGVFGDIMTPRGTTAEEYALGRRYLEELAAATGGRVFRPESTPGGLIRAFESIAEELRRQYNIGYIPKIEGLPGQQKQIRVRVNRPNLVIRARDSYVVGAYSGN
jgi:VWFA-related protein